MRVWLGKGLKLHEFLQLPATEQRARLWEMSDAEQMQFVDWHLDMITAILAGFPPESLIPETEPYGATRPGPHVKTVAFFPDSLQTKHLHDEVNRILKGPTESPDEPKAEILSFPTSDERTFH